MTKEELLNYIDELIEKSNAFAKRKNNHQDDELNSVYNNARSILEDVNNLAYTNFERLDNYVNVPYDALNVLTLYQQVILSKSFTLTEEQKKYINYLFREFIIILERCLQKEEEKEKNNFQNNDLNVLVNLKNYLLNEETINLDSFIKIIKEIKNNLEMEDEKDKLLEALASYLRYIMVGNDYQVGRKGK